MGRSFRASPTELREQRILVLHNRDSGPTDSESADGGGLDTDDQSVARSVARALCSRGHFVEVQGLGSSDISELIRQLQKDPPDLVFNLVESLGLGLGKSARHELLLPSLLELLGVPYTGSTSLTLGLCERKEHTRQILRGAGIPLAEPDSDGRELQVTLCGSEPLRTLPMQELAPLAMPPERLRLVGSSIATPVRRHAQLAAGLTRIARERIDQLAHKCFLTLEICDYGRCDIRLAADGQLAVVEVQPSCDLAVGSGFAHAGQLAGLAYDSLIEQLALSALTRNARVLRRPNGHALTEFPDELAG